MTDEAQDFIVRELHVDDFVGVRALFPAEDFLDDGGDDLGLDRLVGGLGVRDGHRGATWGVEIEVGLVVVVADDVFSVKAAAVEALVLDQLVL